MRYSNAIEVLRGYLSRSFGDLHDAIQAVLLNHDKNLIKGQSFICSACGRENRDHYMLEDRIWWQVNDGDPRGMLHLLCAERALGRKFRKSDFRDIPLNSQARYFADD